MRVRITNIDSAYHCGLDNMRERIEVRGEIVGPFNPQGVQTLFDGKYLVAEGENRRGHDKRWLVALAATCSTEQIGAIIAALPPIAQPVEDA